MPKYLKLSHDLANFIAQTDMQQGEQLPNLQQLCKTYNTSKATVIKALQILEKEGLIYQVQGSGSFVRRPKKTGLINFENNHGFTSDLKNQSLDSIVLNFSKVIAGRQVAEKFNCSPDQLVFKIERIRLRDNTILCLETSYFNTLVVPYLDKNIAKGSIFDYLDKAQHIQVGFSDKYFSVHKLSKEEAVQLQLHVHDPALITNELFYTSTGQAFDYSQNVYHYINAQFYLQIN